MKMDNVTSGETPQIISGATKAPCHAEGGESSFSITTR